MKRRIARKILKRIGHRTLMVSGCEVHLARPNSYKQGTVDRAVLCRRMWGILDLESSTWMGNNDGPFVFEDFDAARAKRQLLAAQIPCSPLRFSVERFVSASRKLDEISLQNTVDQAMELIEQRGY